jgi:hypothetical protein
MVAAAFVEGERVIEDEGHLKNRLGRLLRGELRQQLTSRRGPRRRFVTLILRTFGAISNRLRRHTDHNARSHNIRICRSRTRSSTWMLPQPPPNRLRRQPRWRPRAGHRGAGGDDEHVRVEIDAELEGARGDDAAILGGELDAFYVGAVRSARRRRRRPARVVCGVQVANAGYGLLRSWIWMMLVLSGLPDATARERWPGRQRLVVVTPQRPAG